MSDVSEEETIYEVDLERYGTPKILDRMRTGVVVPVNHPKHPGVPYTADLCELTRESLILFLTRGRPIESMMQTLGHGPATVEEKLGAELHEESIRRTARHVWRRLAGPDVQEDWVDDVVEKVKDHGAGGKRP